MSATAWYNFRRARKALLGEEMKVLPDKARFQEQTYTSLPVPKIAQPGYRARGFDGILNRPTGAEPETRREYKTTSDQKWRSVFFYSLRRAHVIRTLPQPPGLPLRPGVGKVKPLVVSPVVGATTTNRKLRQRLNTLESEVVRLRNILEEVIGVRIAPVATKNRFVTKKSTDVHPVVLSAADLRVVKTIVQKVKRDICDRSPEGTFSVVYTPVFSVFHSKILKHPEGTFSVQYAPPPLPVIFEVVAIRGCRYFPAPWIPSILKRGVRVPNPELKGLFQELLEAETAAAYTRVGQLTNGIRKLQEKHFLEDTRVSPLVLRELRPYIGVKPWGYFVANYEDSIASLPPQAVAICQQLGSIHHSDAKIRLMVKDLIYKLRIAVRVLPPVVFPDIKVSDKHRSFTSTGKSIVLTDPSHNIFSGFLRRGRRT